VNDLSEAIVRRAFGKINLTLRVTGKRQDGYHEVSTVMVPVLLHDVLTFRPGGEGLFVICPDLPGLLPKDNLVTKAAQAVMDVSGFSVGVTVTVRKAIPAGGGMGGGSSDAAAALLSVNGLLPEERRLRPGRLLKVAATIGADVPFFLGCNSVPAAWSGALCTGIGEAVTPLSRAKAFDLVVAFPDFSVDTTQAYRDWDSSGAKANPEGSSREVDVLQALELGDSAQLAGTLLNDLEGPVAARYPQIHALKDALMKCGALGALMTGSGSAVYGICGSQEHAGEVRLRMEAYAKDLGLRGLMALKTGCEI
jgi:4-diphosphocytidyl-2-C-methyl-D-erythritol kinase